MCKNQNDDAIKFFTMYCVLQPKGAVEFAARLSFCRGSITFWRFLRGPVFVSCANLRRIRLVLLQLPQLLVMLCLL